MAQFEPLSASITRINSSSRHISIHATWRSETTDEKVSVMLLRSYQDFYDALEFLKAVYVDELGDFQFPDEHPSPASRPKSTPRFQVLTMIKNVARARPSQRKSSTSTPYADVFQLFLDILLELKPLLPLGLRLLGSEELAETLSREAPYPVQWTPTPPQPESGKVAKEISQSSTQGRHQEEPSTSLKARGSRGSSVDTAALLLYFCSPLLLWVATKLLSLPMSLLLFFPAIRIRVHVLLGQVQVIAVVVVLSQSYHRLLGVLLGCYLRNLLGSSPQNGAWLFQIDWVAVRLGWDFNEIMLHDLQWRNPAHFSQKHHFLNIKLVRISIDMHSLWRAIREGKSVKINEIILSKTDCFIVKGPNKVLNVWACMGARSEKEERALSEHCTANIQGGSRKAVRVATKTLMQGSKVVANTSRAIMGGFSKTGHIAVDLLKRGAGTVAGEKKSTRKQGGHETHGPVRDDSCDGEEEGEGDEEGPGEDAAREEELDDAHMGLANASEAMGFDYDELLIDDYFSDECEPSPSSKGQSSDQDTKHSEAPSSSSSARPPLQHFGVPYLLEVDRISIFDLKLHAADLVCHSHVETKLADIRIQSMNMFRGDLTKPPKDRHSYRRAIYFDDVIWRLINRLIKDLLAKNSMAMTLLMGMGGASQLYGGAMGTVSTVGGGVNAGGRMIGSLFSAKQSRLQPALNES